MLPSLNGAAAASPPAGKKIGAPGLTRTGTSRRTTDFESVASTNSATGARGSAMIDQTRGRSSGPTMALSPSIPYATSDATGLPRSVRRRSFDVGRLARGRRRGWILARVWTSGPPDSGMESPDRKAGTEEIRVSYAVDGHCAPRSKCVGRPAPASARGHRPHPLDVQRQAHEVPLAAHLRQASQAESSESEHLLIWGVFSGFQRLSSRLFYRRIRAGIRRFPPIDRRRRR